MGWLRRYWWAVTAGVVVVGVGLGVYLARAEASHRVLPPSRARVYTSFDACLLTDSAGIGSAQAAPVWSGMQAASLRTSGKVSFLSVYGPDTQANAVPYVNTLVQRRCNLVIAVGASQVAASRERASAYPNVHFVVVDRGFSAGNVTAVAPGKDSDVSSAVKNDVIDAADNISVR